MSLNPPLVSIVIPCFNNERFVEQAVNSALSQTYDPKEIILVDDGSNQKTKQVLKSLELKINLLITQENKGPSAARNIGINKAQGEYILVLDSDDYFEPEFCEKAIDKFDAESEIKMVTCLARWFRSENDFEIFKPSGGKLEDFLKKNCALGTMFKKSDWEIAGVYDENMRLGYEDWEFYIRLHQNGGRTFVIPEILFHYRNTSNSRNKTANLLKYDIELYIYQKHAELYKIYFEDFMTYLMERYKTLNHTLKKRENSVEYQLGSSLLSPMRWVKNLFR